MFEIFKAKELKDLGYCVVVTDGRGGLKTLCEPGTQAHKLSEFVKGAQHACLIEIHSPNRAYTVCDSAPEISKRLAALR